MGTSSGDLALLGREAEMSLLRELVLSTRRCGRGLVFTGEPGVGKSVLLEQAAALARAEGHLVLGVAGIQAESHLPFAGLQQLLFPLIGHAERLGPPQRAALLTALGLSDGPAPAMFLTGLAALTLLTDQAAERPVVLLADDVNWLDESSQVVLAFVARRLGNDPLSFVATMRAGEDHYFADVPADVHQVLPLADELAYRLLDRAGETLTDTERRAISDVAQGNPLALVELPKAWRHRRLPIAATVSEASAAAPTTERLQASFAGRAHALPRLTTDLLLVAAVTDSESLAEILSACEQLTGGLVSAEAADAAVAAGLVRYDESTLRFRHPLVRSALLASESVGRRQRANLAWAASLPHDPARQVRFRGRAATKPDEEIAHALTDLAAASLSRGATLDALETLGLAAQLTPDPVTRGRRLLTAAEQAFELGRADLVQELVTRAAQTPLSHLDQARVTWLSELFHDGDPRDSSRVRQMVADAGRAAAGARPELALNLLYGAAVRCWWSGAGAESRASVARALSLLGRDRDPQVVVALAVAEPLSSGAEVMRVLNDPPHPVPGDADGLRALGQAAWAAGDSVRCVDLLERAASMMRAQGRLGVLVHVLSIQANAQLTLGEWSRAEESVVEAAHLARETNQPIWEMGSNNVAAMLAGLKGNPRPVRELEAGVEAYARTRGLADQLACVCLARAFAYAGQGHHAPACEALLQLFDPSSVYHHERESLHGLMLLAETAAQVGREAEARKVLARMEHLAAITPSPLLQAHLLYARPVLSPDRTAEELYLDGLAQDLNRWPWVRARLELAYGVWLRRRRRVVESRAPLHEAAVTLTGLGADHWAQRARNELRASGGRLEVRLASDEALLSAQEMQIARLAARGMSNKEIGEQLFISARTVASHLYHVFPKLQITSRSQLAARLGMLSERPLGRPEAGRDD